MACNALQVRACELAAEWRQTWGTDVVVDLVGYRRCAVRAVHAAFRLPGGALMLQQEACSCGAAALGGRGRARLLR